MGSGGLPLQLCLLGSGGARTGGLCLPLSLSAALSLSSWLPVSAEPHSGGGLREQSPPPCGPGLSPPPPQMLGGGAQAPAPWPGPAPLHPSKHSGGAPSFSPPPNPPCCCQPPLGRGRAGERSCTERCGGGTPCLLASSGSGICVPRSPSANVRSVCSQSNLRSLEKPMQVRSILPRVF